jgi:uncharacterized protein YabN with tetrapyrrole methylase and pyrophosphatase domain
MDYLKKLTAIEHEAANFGFKWETAEQIIKQIKSECVEINNHLLDQNQEKLQEEIGDLLHAAFSLCVFCKFDPEQTLTQSINKFERRFKLVQLIAQQQGLDSLQGKSFNELMAVWDKAKALDAQLSCENQK